MREWKDNLVWKGSLFKKYCLGYPHVKKKECLTLIHRWIIWKLTCYKTSRRKQMCLRPWIRFLFLSYNAKSIIHERKHWKDGFPWIQNFFFIFLTLFYYCSCPVVCVFPPPPELLLLKETVKIMKMQVKDWEKIFAD